MKGGYNINMRKKGMAPVLVAVLVICALVVAGAILWYTVKQSQLSNPNVVATDCQTAPSLSLVSVDAIDTGTTVATVNDLILNGQYMGTIPSSFQIGDKVELLFNASNYISNIYPEFTIDKCGKTTITNKIYATDDVTTRIFNTGGDKATDSTQGVAALCPGTNQTSSSNTISMKLEVQSAQKQSSGDLVIVVEVDNSTEVGYDGITLSGTGVTAAPMPSYYTVNATTSVARAFNVPASTGGALNTYYINLAPKSGQTIGASGSAGTLMFVNFYSKQAFVDTDGIFKVGIENLNGATKYEDTSDYEVCIIG
jgi:hypothetical protein